jgi:hypothetical protein
MRRAIMRAITETIRAEDRHLFGPAARAAAKPKRRPDEQTTAGVFCLPAPAVCRRKISPGRADRAAASRWSGDKTLH